MALLDELLNRCEDGVEPFAIVLPAPPGAGKTHILKQFCAEPRLAAFEDEYGAVTPFLRISAPAPCTLKTLGIVLYLALTGLTLSSKLQRHDIWTRVRTMLLNKRVSVVMIDELHHVLDNASMGERRDVISTLKALLIGEETDETGELLGQLPPTVKPLPIGLVLSGMPYLKDVIALDLQLQRRCRFNTLKPLGLTGADEAKFKKFLEVYAGRLGFAKNSDIASNDMVLRMHKATRGYRGRAAALLKEAAYVAIDNGHPTVDRVAHLGRVFELIYETGAERNPFLVADVKKLGPIPELDRVAPTLLRGKKKPDPFPA